MTRFKNLLQHFVERTGGTVCFGNNTTIFIRGYGVLKIGIFTIHKSTLCEGLGHIIFSTSQFCDSYFIVRFSITSCQIIDSNGFEILQGKRLGDLYVVDFSTLKSLRWVCLVNKATKEQRWIWYRRLSRQNFSYINKLANNGLVEGLPNMRIDRDSFCMLDGKDEGSEVPTNQRWNLHSNHHLS